MSKEELAEKLAAVLASSVDENIDGVFESMRGEAVLENSYDDYCYTLYCSECDATYYGDMLDDDINFCKGCGRRFSNPYVYHDPSKAELLEAPQGGTECSECGQVYAAGLSPRYCMGCGRRFF